MFTEILKAEVWKKKLEGSGYRILSETEDDTKNEVAANKKTTECQKCGTMFTATIGKDNNIPHYCPICAGKP